MRGGRDGVVSGADFFWSMDVVADGHFALFMTFQNLRYYSTPIYLCSRDVCMLSFSSLLT